MTATRSTPATIAAVVLLCFAAGALAACGDDDATATSADAATTYVGAVPGTPAYVAIAVRGTRVRAYVCDSRELATWFDGTVADGSAALTAADGKRLELTLADRRATGRVTLAPGRTSAFAAVPAEGRAGLYRGVHKRSVAGWIVLADGTQRGGVGSGPGTFGAAPALNAKAIGDGRVAITPIPIPSAGPQLASVRIAPNGGLR